MYPHIHLFAGLDISTYFLLISLGVTVAVLWFIALAEKRHLSRVTAIDLALVLLASGFVGARLVHIFFEEPALYKANPWLVFEVWNGGFVFFGGLIAAFFAGVVFCKVKREPFWFWADVVTLPAALAYAIGRLACFLNGCCYGQPADVPWAVELHGQERHPTQLYASLWELITLASLYIVQGKFKISGALFNSWLISHAIGRIVMETFRGDPRGDLVLGVSLGTMISIVLMFWALSNLLAAKMAHR